MRRAAMIVVFLLAFGLRAASQAAPALSEQPANLIDGIAVRIEDDIITESDVRELQSFQELVNGKARSRAEVVDELIDQWVVRNEATTSRFPHPSATRIDAEFAQLEKQLPSPEAFRGRLRELGLSENAVRRLVEQQHFLTRFLDYRFRPDAQVEQAQIEAYYNGEFAAKLKAENQPLPPLDQVEDQIHELLTQRDINERATRWVDDTKQHLRIDISSGGAGS
jgi:hypothetical protein